MRIRPWIAAPLTALAFCTAASGQTAQSEIDAHIATAKAAAGLDFRGTFVNLCLPGGFPPGGGRAAGAGRGANPAASLLTPRPAPEDRKSVV